MDCVLKRCGMSKFHREKFKTIRSCIFMLMDVATDLIVAIDILYVLDFFPVTFSLKNNILIYKHNIFRLKQSNNNWIAIAMISFIFIQNIISFIDLYFNNKRGIISIFGLCSLGIIIEAMPILFYSQNLNELKTKRKQFMYQRGHEILFEAIPNVCLQFILIISYRQQIEQYKEISTLTIISIIFSLISIGRGFATIDANIDDLDYLGLSWRLSYAIYISLDVVIRFIPLCLFFSITQYYPYSILFTIIIIYGLSVFALIFSRFEEEYKSQKSDITFLKHYRDSFESVPWLLCLMKVVFAIILSIPNIATGYMLISVQSIFFHWVKTGKRTRLLANCEFIIRYLISMIIMILWFNHEYKTNATKMFINEESDKQNDILFSITRNYISFGNICIPHRLILWSFIVFMAIFVQIIIVCCRKCCCIRMENTKYNKRAKLLKSLRNSVGSQSSSKSPKSELKSPSTPKRNLEMVNVGKETRLPPPILISMSSLSDGNQSADDTQQQQQGNNETNEQQEEPPKTPTSSINCPV